MKITAQDSDISKLMGEPNFKLKSKKTVWTFIP